MVCLIKSKYEEELNHLTEVLGSYKRAYAVLCCNNGYTLDKTKEGKSSKLYNDLLEYYKGDVNKAEQKKAQLFTSDFTDTYGKWFQDGFEIQEQYKDVFDENGEPILFRSGKQVELTKEGISTKAQQKLNNANSFIKNHLQIKSGPIRNKKINDDLLTLNGYIKWLYYDITGQYLELDSDENIYDQIEFAINNTDFESAAKEELKNLKDSQIKPNASSVAVKKSLIDSFLSNPDLSRYNEEQKQIIKKFLPALFKSEDSLTNKRIGFYKHNIKKIHAKIDASLDQEWQSYFINRGKQIKLQNFLDYLELSPDYRQHIREKIFSEIGRYVARNDSKYFQSKNRKKNLLSYAERGFGKKIESVDFSEYFDESTFKTSKNNRIIYGHAKTSNVLQKIVNNSSADPRLRKSAEFLLKYVKNNQDFDIIFTDPGDRTLFEEGSETRTALGVNDTMSRTIYIRTANAYDNKEHVLIHEIAHSLTTAALYEQQIDDTKIWKGLEKYIEYISGKAGSSLEGLIYDNYWQKNPQEFVAEFFGNAEFQEMLKEIPPVDQKKFNNIFEELLNWLYELFTGKPANAFEQIKPVMKSLVISQADRNLIDKVHFQEQNYLENPYFGTSDDKILLEEKSENFEQPYDAERFATSEQSMEEQYILENAKRDSEGRLLAPNGKPSNLTEKQYVQVRTKAFKDWFGDWEKEYTPQTNIYKENPWERYMETEDTGRTYIGHSGKTIPIIINKGVKYVHPVERITPTDKDPFGFNSYNVNNLIVVGKEVDADRNFNGICQVTARACKDFLKNRYNIESSVEIINAKSPVKDDIIEHWVNVLSINGEAYIYDMPQTEYIKQTKPLIYDNKELNGYYEGVITSKYTPRLIKVTEENLSKFYKDNNKNDKQIKVIKNTVKRLNKDKKSINLNDLQYKPAYNKNVSKVVDENGEPLVVYHSTNKIFNTYKERDGIHFGSYNTALGVANEKFDPTFDTIEEAQASIAKGKFRIDQVFLNIRNPKQSKDLGTGWKQLITEGFDGGLYMAVEGDTSFVVFDSNQIKSATDNNGDFSRTNDNIYKRHGEDRDRHIYSRERAVKYIKDQGYTIDNLVHDTYETRFEVTLKAKVKEDIWRQYIENMDPGLRVKYAGVRIGKKDPRLEVQIKTKEYESMGNLNRFLNKKSLNTAQDLLQYIIKQTRGEDNHNFSFIISILKDINKINPGLFNSVNIRRVADRTGNYSAKYDSNTRTIIINVAKSFANENNFKNALVQTLTHEMIHVVTVEALQRSKILRAKAEKLLSKLKEQFNDDPSIQGLQNVYEMVAELSNDEFINKLKQVQYDTKQTWLDKIKSFISRLISRYLQSIGIQYNNTAYKELVDIFVQASYSKQIGLELGENIDNNWQFNRLWFNKQSYIDRFKEARKKIRAAKDQRFSINKIRTKEERTIQDLFESIENSTLSKDKSYKSKFSETSSIYGDEKQIAFNQNAVREVQMQHQTIAEAIESKSADEVMTAFAEGVLQFVERADTDINNILAMLINAKDNNYDMVYYNIDNFGNRVYQDTNGNSITAATATNTTQTQPFSFDEIQYITKDICGFYDNLLSNIERMLVIIQPGSNPVIDEINRLISDLDLRKKLTYIQNMKRVAQEHMLDFWIKEKIESQESSELTDDMKKRLTVNIKKWVSAQYDFGDTNSFERICGLFSDAKSPVVRMVIDEIYKMAQETDRRTEEDIDGIKEQYDKALREHSLIGKASLVNPFTYLMQKDRRGLYNGDFIQPINKRQFYTDLEDFKAWLLYGKRKNNDKKHNRIFYTSKNIEDLIKEELNDKDFKLDVDEFGNPDIPINTPGLRSIYKDYLRGMNEFMSKYANRRFTREYYAERIDTLSAITLKAVDSLNSQITAIKKSCTINGKFKPNLLTSSQKAQLQELQKQRLNLSSYYDEFGNEKQIDSDEYQIAEDLNNFQNKISGKIKYNPDYESFNEVLNSIQSPTEKRQFQAMFSYVGINPKYLDMIEQSEYDGSDADVAEGLQDIKELGRDLRKLINLHKLNDTYVSYDWSFMFDMHTKKLTKNGIKFLQKINELQSRIENIKYQIKPGLKGHFNVTKPGAKKNQVISDAFLGVKCIDGTLGNNDFTFKEEGSLFQYLMQAYVQQLEDEGMSVTDAQSKADQLFYTRDGNALKVFTIPIPHVNQFKYEENGVTHIEKSYKIIPNLLFNKLDIDNSDSKYVNKDYNESDNDFIQPKDEYYHDSQYDKVKNTKPELFKLMQLLQEKLDKRVYKQLPFLQQYDGRLPQIGARSMSILTRNLTKKAGLQIFSNIGTIWNRDVNANEQDTDLYIPEKTKRPDGSEIKNIPIRYVDRLEDPSMISSDLVGSVVAMIRMANNYKVKIENVNKFETILTNIQENENTQSTHSKQFEDMLNRDVYERRAHTDLFSEDWEHFNWFRKLIFGGSATFLKRIGIVRGISQKVMLACRLVSQIVSMLDPLMCTLVEVGCGRYYNKRDFTKCVTLLIKELPAAILSLGKSGSYSRTMGIIDSLQLGESLTKRYQNLYRTQIGRVVSKIDGMIPFSLGDYFIKALNVNMIYNSTRMYIDDNGNIEFLSKEPFIDKCVENGMSFKEANRAYYNAKTARNCVKMVNGQIKIVDNRMTPEQYQSIGNRTKKIIQTMTRMILEEDKTWLQTNTWAAFVTMLRTFLLVGISERFRNFNDFIVGETETGEVTDKRLNKSDIRKARKKHYYRGGFNFMTGFIENGPYRSFFSGLGHILSNTKRMQTVLSSFLFKYKHVSQQDMKNIDLSRQEVYAVGKILRELGLVTMFVTASVMMNAYVSTLPPDDEHWLLFLINAVLMRQGIEMMAMYNPSTVSDLITSITTLTSSVDKLSQILDLLGDYAGITGHNPDEIIKSSSQYKNRTRQYKALMNAFAYFGTAGWYSSMPESMGGGGSYALDKSTQWYANTAPWRLLYKKQNVDADKPKKKRSRPIGVN